MKIKISELRRIVREGLAALREDYEVGANDRVDTDNPTILWNDTFDMHDQETMTKVANRRNNLNEPDPKDEDAVDKAIRTLLGPDAHAFEAKKPKKGKKDSYGCESPFAINKYAKAKSKYKDGKPMSMKEAVLEASTADKCVKGYLGPFKKRRKDEDKYPSSSGWQGEKYRDDSERAKLKKKKKKVGKAETAVDALKEVSPPGWEGTVKAMKRDKKKKKTKIDNPWALSWYMKGKGDKSHYTKSGKKKKNESAGIDASSKESNGEPRTTLPKLPKKVKPNK